MPDLYQRPIAVDLFAGVGGFSLGIEQAGFDVLVAVEQDPVHAAVHSFNFPRTHVLCADITKLSGEEIRQACKGNPIDLVFGGPPCQGFSVMGKRLIDDDRNDLVFDFYRLVVELRPRYFVMENVPGICQGKHAVYLHQLCEKFVSAGYEIAKPRVLNAADFGVPQNRKRLFLLGSRIGERPLAYPEPSCSSKTTVRDAIASLPNLDDFPELRQTDEVWLKDTHLHQMQVSASKYAKMLLGLEPDEDNFGYPRQWYTKMLTSSMRTQHSDTSIERFNSLSCGHLEPISRLRRLDWDGLSHTLRAGTGAGRGRYTSPRPIHPDYPRVISVREAARLHSFPDWFRFHATKWHGFRQVGNAVPPMQARAVGRQVINALGIKPPNYVEPMHPLLPLGFAPSNTQLLRFNLKEAGQYWKQVKPCRYSFTPLYEDRHP